jgi:hypothetical protein
MSAWLIALAIGAAVAALQYARLRAPSGSVRILLAAMRALAIAIVVALLLDAPLGRARPIPPWAFVDASLSMTRGDTSLWRVAWDSARRVGAESLLVFGDSVRRGDPASRPADATTHLRPVVERTIATGRPVVLVTDGETQDSSALDALTTGSRVIVLPRRPQRDIALTTMEAPRAGVEGDSLAIRMTVAAGSEGAAAGQLTLHLDRQLLGRWPLDAMSPWAERQYDLRIRVEGAQGAGILRAVAAVPGDLEARNDTLSAVIEISRAASAVFVSTSPDQDARFAVAILRGALALPTRGFLRVAPGQWRHEGSLAPATEAEVRQAFRDAPIAILHGDTTVFGPLRTATMGPVALLVPPESEDGEWYATSTPISPLSGALAALPLDSLPPIAAGVPATGDWTALEARRGREPTRRAVVVGRDSPRRVIVTGAGFWRWRFRAGASADAYAALWGGIFDWLAAERADRRGAVPDAGVVRAGQMIRWRRGSSADSVVRASLQRRSATPTGDSLTLRFPAGLATVETPPLPSGVYDVTVPGGRTVLVVNESAELVPLRPRLRSSAVGRRARSDDARRARTTGWLYALAILLLCAEWVARRRAGMR